MKNAGIPALIKAVDKLGFTVIEVRQEQGEIFSKLSHNDLGSNKIITICLVPPDKQDNRPPGGYGGGGGGPAGGDKRASERI
jgi:hypothetical protein